MDSPPDELALAALDVSQRASPQSIQRLTRAVATFDRIDVPWSHEALLSVAKQAIEATPEAWPRHSVELGECLRALPRVQRRERERKDLM